MRLLKIRVKCRRGDKIKLIGARLSINEDSLPRHITHTLSRQSCPISELSRFGALLKSIQGDLRLTLKTDSLKSQTKILVIQDNNLLHFNFQR